MKIETKFNVGDEVFVLVGTKLEKRIVFSLKVDVENDGKIEVKYFFKVQDGEKQNDYHFEIIDESKIFASKDEFLNQLETE